MQTQNYCVFTIHSPCPHSNQIAGRLTSSSGVECAEWKEMDERQGKWQPFVFARVYGCASSQRTTDILSKIGSIIIFSPHLVFSMFNNQVIFFLAINSLMR